MVSALIMVARKSSVWHQSVQWLHKITNRTMSCHSTQCICSRTSGINILAAKCLHNHLDSTRINHGNPKIVCMEQSGEWSCM
jgi:hypothetical protein